MEQLVDARIVEEAQRITLKAGVLAVLLAGSYARGQASPYSDVDLLVITESDPKRTEVADVDWTTFDICYTTMEELEQDIARSYITCNSMLHLRVLIGDATWEQRIERLARQRHPHYVPQSDALEDMRQQVRVAAMHVGLACATGDRVAQAQTGGDVVWLAGRMCLSLAGLGPMREDQWHELLRTASLPFEAATPLAQWYLGNALDERLAAWTLAERALGEPLPVTQVDELSLPSAPAFQARSLPDALEAVEMHRLVKIYGFGKMAKALWMKDKVRQASEAGVIVWFSVPACLALGGLISPEPFWWHEALCKITLSFDAAMLYRYTMLGASFEERKDATCTFGKRTVEALEPHFRNTPFEHKYRRD
ncbi:MAG TPA: nucleotidyltransferase domain-containing protein [Ktedonobacteraceae bacterium]|nr:nucleotidyltransferase domain-containing protein [Ktedonobacteraceae bacterium]